jgi:O-antigen/teichoic acid export membrane protein
VSSRVRRAGLTTLANGGLSVARAAASFMTVSMLVRYLGRETYGLAVTITGIAAWLSVLQSGIGQSVKNEIIRRPEAAGNLVSGALSLLLGIVFAAGTALTLAARSLPWKTMLNDPAFGSTHMRLIVAAIWIVLLTALMSPVRAAYSAFQAEFMLAAPMLVGLVLCFALAAIGIRERFSMTFVVSAPLAANLAGLLLGLWMMPRVLGVRFARFGRTETFFQGGLWFFLIETCTILILQADVFLVNLLLGQTQAAIFALHLQLFVYIQTGIALIVTPYWPAFGEAWVNGERRWLETGVRRLAMLTALLAGSGSLALIVFGRLLMAWWSHGEVEWNPALAALIGINTVIQSVAGVYATALGSLGIARDPALIASAQAALNLALCVWLIRRFGITGSAWGSLLSYAIASGWYLPWKFRRVLA